MIPFIDNIEYNGPLPNFSRDKKTWEEMMAVTEEILDKGHIVVCTSPEEKQGHYVFLGVTQEEEELVPTPKWSQIVDKDGIIVGATANPIPEEFILSLDDDEPIEP